MGIFNIPIIFAQLLQPSPNFKHCSIRFVVCELNFGGHIKLNPNNFSIFTKGHLCELTHNDRPQCESSLFFQYVTCRFNNSCTIIVLRIKISLIFNYVVVLLVASCSIFTVKELIQKVEGNREESIYYDNEVADTGIVFAITKLTIFGQQNDKYGKAICCFGLPMIKSTQKLYDELIVDKGLT
jgi:hypothetical protein